MDFKRVPRQQQPAQPTVRPVQPEFSLPDLTLSSVSEPTKGLKKRKTSKKRLFFGISGGLLLLALTTLVGGWFWYQAQLGAVNPDDQTKKVVVITNGSTPDTIATQLHTQGLIKNALAFLWYTRSKDVQGSLQAGTYRLSPSETTQTIVEHLVGGKVDTFQVTFLPGATLAQNKQALIDVGYEAAEIDAAFAKTYMSPLFEGKPATADLEGYIYGETYSFGTDATVESVLQHVFDHYADVIAQENLVAAYKTQGLSLYEGITLASIVQREASPSGSDAPHIAQVFYTRLAQGMPLGSDVTYQYIADKTGVGRDVNLDSPYNTRRYAGLPPGPIAAPGLTALRAVAKPAAGDYVYFLSGDDDITYFGRTLQEHEANIKQHCAVKCQII